MSKKSSTTSLGLSSVDWFSLQQMILTTTYIEGDNSDYRLHYLITYIPLLELSGSQGSSEEGSLVTLSHTLTLNNYHIKSIGVDRQPKKHYLHLGHTAMLPKSEISPLTPASRSHTSCSWKISVSSCQCPYPLFTPAWSRKDCNISQAKVHILHNQSVFTYL